MLQALSISIETLGRTYDVISNESPEADSASLFRGTVWPRWLLSLGDGVTIKQQMVLRNGGNAVGASWRLVSPALVPVRLRVGPVFSAGRPIRRSEFEIEPETNGGRLTWQPYAHAEKIITDTNGSHLPTLLEKDYEARFSPNQAQRHLAQPASFEFDLRPKPALLVFRTELQDGPDLDLLVDGFLAQLTERRGSTPGYDNRRRLAA